MSAEAHAARVATGGVLVGLALCWPAAAALRGFLYGVGMFDPSAWLLAPACLIGVGLLAALAPAMRASRVDPLRILQME